MAVLILRNHSNYFMLDNLFHKKHPNVSQKREEENKENILSSVEDAKTNTFMLLAKKRGCRGQKKHNEMKKKSCRPL